MHRTYNFDPIQQELLVEACRIADTLEELNKMMTGDKSAWMWIKMPRNADELILNIDDVANQRRQLQLAFKTITATLTVAGEGAGRKDVPSDPVDDITRRREARIAERRAGRAVGEPNS